MVTDGVLEKLFYAGSDVSLCLHKTRKLETSTFYKGGVRGWPTSPFARQGPGWMHYPAHLRSERPHSILRGHWLNDKFTSVGAPLLASSSGTDQPRKILLSTASECRDCLSVYDARKQHLCPTDRRNPSSAKRRPQPSAAMPPARCQNEARASHTSGDELNASDRQRNDVCQLVGFHDGLASAFVLQRLSFEKGQRLGGGKGARAFCAYDTQKRGRSVCFAAACRNSITCSMRDTCPHIEAVRDSLAVTGSRVPPGLTLDGYLALTTKEPEFLRPRRCTAEYCQEAVGQRRMKQPKRDVGDDAARQKQSCVTGKRSSGDDRDERAEGKSDSDPSSSSSESSDSDGDDSQASTAATQEFNPRSIAYGYIPKISEVMGMSPSRLKAVSAELSLDATCSPQNMQYNIIEYYNPDEVVNLPQKLHTAHEAFLNGSAQKSRPHKRQRCKATAGVRGREADVDTAKKDQSFKYAERARRCVQGSMCTEHALQKSLAVSLYERIDSAESDDDVNAAEDAEVDDDVPGPSHAEGAAEADVLAQECEKCEEEQADAESELGGSSSQGMRQSPMAWAEKPKRGVKSSPLRECEGCSSSECNNGTPDDVIAESAVACNSVGGEEATLKRPQRGAAKRAQSKPGFRSEVLPSRVIEFLQQQDCKAPTGPTACRGPTDVGGAMSVDGDEPVGAERGKEHTRIHLSPSQAEDFLYSITLAKARGGEPVIPISKNQYAVLRTEPDQCSYSCPGGYSLVKAELSADPLRATVGGTILSLSCTCSEYRSCRTGMGGRSKKGSKKFCTCCIMVVAANVLDAPLARLRRGDSPWLLASRRHIPVS